MRYPVNQRFPKAINNRFAPGLIASPGFSQRMQPRFAGKQKKQKPKKDVKKTIKEGDEDDEEESEKQSSSNDDKASDKVKENG